MLNEVDHPMSAFDMAAKRDPISLSESQPPLPLVAMSMPWNYFSSDPDLLCNSVTDWLRRESIRTESLLAFRGVMIARRARFPNSFRWSWGRFRLSCSAAC
jgi:hypothetical protein